MNRFETLVAQRFLFLSDALGSASAPSDASLRPLAWFDDQGRVRVMVLSARGRIEWPDLAPLWRAVQSDLGWPAPAIAVAASQGWQLWFALAEPLPAARAHQLVSGVSQRFLPLELQQMLRPWPPAEGSAARDCTAEVEWVLNATQAMVEGQWPAFVTPDLAAVFGEAPWLDLPPSPEGQADLLQRLQPLPPGPWADLFAQTVPAPSPPHRAEPLQQHLLSAHDPLRFLLAVMADDAVDLALRLQAAQALLPYRDRCLDPSGQAVAPIKRPA